MGTTIVLREVIEEFILAGKFPFLDPKTGRPGLWTADDVAVAMVAWRPSLTGIASGHRIALMLAKSPYVERVDVSGAFDRTRRYVYRIDRESILEHKNIIEC